MKRSDGIGASDPTGSTGAVASAGGTFEIEVVVQTESSLVQRTLRLPSGSRVADAMTALSDVLDAEQMPSATSGIFGQQVTPETVLAPGDRLEVYQPIQCDPKAMRRERARLAAPKPKPAQQKGRREKASGK